MAFPNLASLSLIVAATCLPAAALDRVEILISDSAQAVLEANPYDADKVSARWIALGDTSDVVVSYRGAYTLRNQLSVRGGPRNWKLKTPKASPYRGLREWNFNNETNVRQKLALDLFAQAGSPVLPSRHVELWVNARRQGIYLEFPDPDNKPWMVATFGNDSGDLYKAATDIPGSPAFFGELTDLGTPDSSYWKHYQKKTNNDGIDSSDYTRLRDFIVWINRSSDAEFHAGLRARFDLDAFLRYLVVANFASHWDGYPNRGKNYWLHLDRATARWSMIPWDVDGTFQSDPFCLDNMGPNAGLLFMEWPKGYCQNSQESRSRPLLERILAVDEWKRLYLGEYQKALRTWLDEDSLQARLDSLDAVIRPSTSGAERTSLSQATTDMRGYIATRSARVASLLSAFPAYDPIVDGVERRSASHLEGAGPWVDSRGRKLSSLERASSGVWRRGREIRAIVR